MIDASKNKIVLPGETIGVLGGGQLGRMLAMSAARLGYKVIGYSPEKDPPLSQVAEHIQAEYEDMDSLAKFASQVKVVTLEFENIPALTTSRLEELVPVYPSTQVLQTTQHRLREKKFLLDNNFPLAPFREVSSNDSLMNSAKQLGFPCILKTAGFGYDGKGQTKFQNEVELQFFLSTNTVTASVLESFVQFDKEISLVCARSKSGNFVHWNLFENVHKNHVLDLTICPAKVTESVADQAVLLGKKITEKLGVVGTFCIEFFVTKDQKLIVNELAPRPHNSGHLTIEASVTSQFEQQLRAVTGLPLGSTKMHRPAAMVNLLGDVWAKGEPNWKKVLDLPDVYLHLYGKEQARPGRKMGHITCLADKVDTAREVALKAREMLT